jgi:aryl-alcohol dehydrogenase-like predicted oxidoreductase
VPRVLTGLWQIADMERDGSTVDPEDSAAAMERYVQSGLTGFDMADHYGSAEVICGHYRATRGTEAPIETLTKWVPKPGAVTMDDVRVAVDRASERLRTERLDLLQFHGGDAETLQREGLLDQLISFREQGLIRHLGVSSSLPNLPALIELNVFETFQVPYSCLAPEHGEWLTRAAETGAGVIIRGGIAHGGPDAEIKRPQLNDVWEQARLAELLPADMTKAELILRYTLSHPHCHTTIVGTCNPEHLAENVAAAKQGPLPADLYQEITQRVASL